MNFKKQLMALLVLVACALTTFAQQMPPIPMDPNVRVGKLENGLTYYIRHNNYPEGQANFYIAQKVGSVIEEDNQRGLAHFLEHMCFNGTEKFPGNGVIKYLESIVPLNPLHGPPAIKGMKAAMELMPGKTNVVVPDTATIELTIHTRHGQAMLSVDNRTYHISDGTHITIRRAKEQILLATPHNISFYEALHCKMMWDADIRN